MSEVLARKHGIAAQLLLDPKNLIQLGQALGSARGSSFDLPSTYADDDIRNRDILRLSRSMGNHDTPVGGIGILGSLYGLRERTDLVHFEQQGIAGLELDGFLDENRVGDSQIVAGRIYLSAGEEIYSPII